ITRLARATGVGLVSRGLAVKALFTCVDTPPPPESIGTTIYQPPANLDMQTAQEQTAYRASMPVCGSCHTNFDPYGLVLEWYDVVGRFRTVDDLGKPVDGHTTLPPEVGGTEVQTAIQLADVLTRSDVFTNCLAKSALQYALVDAQVELPLPAHNQAGCAAAGVADGLRRSKGQSFTDLVRAIAASPAFTLRSVEATTAAGQETAALAPAPSPRRARLAAAPAP